MNHNPHLYIAATYSLYAIDEQAHAELVERTSPERPFRFITGMGFALDAFEERLSGLQPDTAFDFTLTPAEAFGTYDESHVVNLEKTALSVDGKFDERNVQPGKFIPLVNDDGTHFHALVLEVDEETVRLDLNHPLAGKSLRFRGTVVASHPATQREMNNLIQQMAEEDFGGDDTEENSGAKETPATKNPKKQRKP